MAKTPRTVENLPAVEDAASGGALVTTTDEFSSHAGAGLENVTSSDILIPRISILQALSPQLKRNNSAFIQGAEEGVICDVGTGELFPDGIIFLPVLFRKDYLEWAPRASGKGLCGVHGAEILDDCVEGEKGRLILPNGNYIMETSQFFGFNMSAGRRRSFIPFASTQLRKSRRWLTMATGEVLNRPDGSEFTPPLFYRTYTLQSAPESNNEGEWYGWTVERGVPIKDYCVVHAIDWKVFFPQILSLVESLKSGKATADVASMQEETAPSKTNDQGRM